MCLLLPLLLACSSPPAAPAVTQATAASPERDHSADWTYSVSCRRGPDGRISATRHEALNIYEHGHRFAGRSHQSPTYRGRQYGWGGRVPITDTLYTEFRQVAPLLNRPAFARVGGTDGVIYVYVQSLGCLFDRYVPRETARPK
jgi:hypothetical protein